MLISLSAEELSQASNEEENMTMSRVIEIWKWLVTEIKKWEWVAALIVAYLGLSLLLPKQELAKTRTSTLRQQ